MKTVTEITAEKKEASEIRLAAYCRVSSGSTDQRHSLAAQIQYYSDYCKQNPQCRIWIGITDEALLGGITDLLNDVIAHPERLQATTDAYSPGEAVQRLEAEIRQTLERGTFDKAVLRQKILDCAARKYREIEDTVYLTEALKAELEQSGPLSAYSEALTRRCVRAILLQADATVCLALVNGQTIGKEESR